MAQTKRRTPSQKHGVAIQLGGHCTAAHCGDGGMPGTPATPACAHSNAAAQPTRPPRSPLSSVQQTAINPAPSQRSSSALCTTDITGTLAGPHTTHRTAPH